MTIAEPQRLAGERGSDRVVPWPHRSKAPLQVSFDRLELRQILNLYGRMVAAGEWRDYAIDFLRDRAVFSVFRRSSERALYRIEKNPGFGAPPRRLRGRCGTGGGPEARPRAAARPQGAGEAAAHRDLGEAPFLMLRAP